MSKININNSPNVIISNGNWNNLSITNGNEYYQIKSKKPKWLKCLSWIFIVGCLLWACVSIYIKYTETGSFDNINFGWKELIQLGGVIIGIVMSLY